MKTDGGHEIEEKDLEEMGLKPGEEPQQGGALPGVHGNV